MQQYRVLFTIAVTLFWSLGFVLHAKDPPQARKELEPLQATLDRIHGYASGEEWRKEDWQEEKLQGWLDELIARIRAVAETPQIKVPQKLSEVRPADFTRYRFDTKPPVRFSDEDLDLTLEHWRGLLVCKSCRLGSTKGVVVVLADGDVEAQRIENAIIIARGTVRLRNATRSLIIAGNYAHVFDANEGSVVISRGWVDVQRANDSVVVGQEGVAVQNWRDTRNSVLIGVESSPAELPGAKAVQSRELDLGRLAWHPLGAQLEFRAVLHESKKDSKGRRKYPQPSGLVFRFEGRQCIADLDQPILDEGGQPLTALPGWKLSFISNEIATFRRGEEQAVVRIAGKSHPPILERRSPFGAELDETTLQQMLDLIPRYNAGYSERIEQQIEAWLDKRVAQFSKAAELPDLKLPVRFGLSSARATEPPTGGLIVGKDLQLEQIKRSIVLSTGDVSVDLAEDSIIIAHGIVQADRAVRCVICSGVHADIRMAGSVNSAGDGCVIMSRGWADVDAHGTVVAAAKGQTMGYGRNNVVINHEVGRFDEGSRSVQIDGWKLDELNVHPVCTKMEFQHLLFGRMKGYYDLQATGMVFRLDGQQLVALRGEPIVDESGKAVAALRGWKLKHVDRKIAIFSTDGDDGIVRITNW